MSNNRQPKAEPVPEPPPPAPPPETKPEVQPAEPPKVVAKPEVAKPDIAIKDKVEKERRVVEPKQPETKKREEDTQAAQKQQAAETQRLAREQEDAQRKLGEQAASARLALIDKYKRAISEKIKKFIVLPPNMQGNPESEFDVVALPDGNVLNARLKRSSGNTAYDNAVERAINRAQPLPMPPDPALLKEFRELNLKFKPQE